MIKDLIIERIDIIKSEEENFKSYWWKDIFISYTKTVNKLPLSSHIPVSVLQNITEHISEVNFDDMSDDDLVRLFEHVILTRNEISNNRVEKKYFSEYDFKSNL
jgi:hypothetical protein